MASESEIVDRLDKIIKVLAVQVGMDRSLSERIYLLRLAGLDNATIAEVLEVTPATVRAIQSFVRRRALRNRAIRRRRRKRA